jgi:nitroreductase
MIFREPLEEIVRRRYSVRTYSKKQIPEEIRQEIAAYAETLSGPFPAKASFKLIETALEPNGAKLGTYGMIKGASVFVASTVPDVPFAVQALGYEFEKLILFITSLGLGTCWLGGTFNRSEFVKTLDGTEGALFPAVSPVGYYEKKSLRESLVRGFVKADTRRPWETMFFDSGFSSPLRPEASGAYAFPLEMLRLGPSASNKQPWRVVKTENRYHFYEHKLPGYSGAFNFDMQGIDMGIAACHFHLACLEKGIAGAFRLDADPKLPQPENVIYQFTWEAGA